MKAISTRLFLWSIACFTWKLQGVQNFAARIVSATRKFDHITPVLKELCWLPVKTQLYYRDAALSFKCMTGRVPDYLSVQFVKREKVSGRQTRGSQMLHIPLFKSTSGQKTFYYRAVSLWNRLDGSFKHTQSVANFKCKLRSRLLERFMQS